jgi:hypothetical protein
MINKEVKPKIEVFFSRKSNQFRAIIKESENPQYEVTVGGSEWNKGKGLKYKDIILKKIKSKIDDLSEKYNYLT